MNYYIHLSLSVHVGKMNILRRVPKYLEKHTGSILQSLNDTETILAFPEGFE